VGAAVSFFDTVKDIFAPEQVEKPPYTPEEVAELEKVAKELGAVTKELGIAIKNHQKADKEPDRLVPSKEGNPLKAQAETILQALQQKPEVFKAVLYLILVDPEYQLRIALPWEEGPPAPRPTSVSPAPLSGGKIQQLLSRASTRVFPTVGSLKMREGWRTA